MCIGELIHRGILRLPSIKMHWEAYTANRSHPNTRILLNFWILSKFKSNRIDKSVRLRLSPIFCQCVKIKNGPSVEKICIFYYRIYSSKRVVGRADAQTFLIKKKLIKF